MGRQITIPAVPEITATQRIRRLSVVGSDVIVHFNTIHDGEVLSEDSRSIRGDARTALLQVFDPDVVWAILDGIDDGTYENE